MKTYLLLFSIFAFSIFLYTYKLDVLPYTVHTDEGETALQTLRLIKGETNIIGVGWFDVPLLSFVPHAITMLIFGKNIVGLRLGSVLFGFLTLSVFYLLTRLLSSTRVALVSTLLLSTSHLWIALSRLGIPYVQATFFLVCTLYFFVLAIKERDTIKFMISGVFFALCFYSYYGARIIPFLIISYLVSFIGMNRVIFRQWDVKVKKYIVGFIIFIASALFIFAPQGKFFLEHPGAFFSRSKSVYVFSDSGRQWTNYNRSNNEILRAQLEKTFNIFVGDNGTQYGYKGQLLDFFTIGLFFLGIIYIVRYFTIYHILLIVWLFLALLGQIFTTIPTPIFLPRFVVGLPVIFIFCALGLELLFNLFQQYKKLLPLVSLFIIVYIIFYNLDVYFNKYPRQQSMDFGARIATIEGRFINALPQSYKTILLTAPYFDGNFSSLNFLTLDRQKIVVDNPQNYSVVNSGRSVLGVRAGEKTQERKTIYIVHPNYATKLKELIETYPNGEILELKDKEGVTQLLIYKVKE